MTDMKHSLIGMSLCASLLIFCGGCSNENGIDNAGEASNNLTALTIRATASNFDNLPAPEKDASLTRTPTEDGLETQFAVGDAIGIFAIKDGAIVDGISNTKLTYATGSTGNSWTPPTGITLYWYEGVSYVAYYPYKDGITIDASKNATEIIASLAANNSLQPGTSQATAADYTACDLMTASGTPTVNATDPAKKILTLNFKHQFALLVLKPQVFVACTPPAGAGFVYRSTAMSPIMDTKATSVTLNGVTACKMSDGSYRAIVMPNASAAPIAGEYKTSDGKTDDANKTIVYSGNNSTFVTGNCYTLEVNSPFPGSGSTERALAPGDFVFHGASNIEIYPGDGPLTSGKIPDYSDAVGMVTTCAPERMTDEGCKDNNWNHAYVMGLVNCGGSMNWGPNVDESVLPNTMRDNGAENNMNGYTETEAMLTERVSKGDLSSYGTFNAINTYRTSNPVPSGLSGKRSPWFAPSVGQWFDVMANICERSPKTFRNNTAVYSWIDNSYGTEMWNKINSQLNKVEKPLSLITATSVVFLCSSEADASNGWSANWLNGAAQVELGTIPKSVVYALRVVRPFFAF